jgi:hypothetical protein
MYDFFILSRIENGIFVYHNVDYDGDKTLDLSKDPSEDASKDKVDLPKNDKGITYFLYHVLKNNNIVDSEDVNVLIYEHNIVKNTCDLIILQDKNKSELEEFDKENLESIFYDIIKNIETIKVNSNNMLSVSYSNNNYNTSFKPFNCNFDGKIVIDTIEYIAL